MRYLKTYESMREDFYKEIESIRKRENDIIQSTKEEVDEYMYDITDDYLLPMYSDEEGGSPKISTIYVNRNQSGEVEETRYVFRRYKDGGRPSTPDFDLITIDSSFVISYYLKCDYSEDGGYRLYDKKDKLDYFLDELESSVNRVKEKFGLEHRLKAKLVTEEGEAHDINHTFFDINYLSSQLKYRKEVNIYQLDKFGKKEEISSPPYSSIEIKLEFL